MGARGRTRKWNTGTGGRSVTGDIGGDRWVREKVEGLRVWHEDEGILIGGRDKGSVGFRLELPSDSAPLRAETIDEKSDLCLLCFDEPACPGCPEP